MQRKNNILNSCKKCKNAMAMIMAIIVIVIIGTIMTLSLSLTSLTTKRTNDLYLYEQSMLLAKSATEYTLLLIAQRAPCSDINTTFRNFTQDGIYNISINIQYIYYDDPDTANNEAEELCTNSDGDVVGLFTSVSTPEQNGSALIDVSVSVLDGNVSAEPIRYFRRTLQKL